MLTSEDSSTSLLKTSSFDKVPSSFRCEVSGYGRNSKLRQQYAVISSSFACMVFIDIPKFNFVETPRIFTITKLTIRKLGSSLLERFRFGTATLIYLLANQMCRTYPINQSNCLKIGKR